MPVSATERRFILEQLGKRAREDMIRLWDAAARLDDGDFFRHVVEAFPDIAIGYHAAAVDVSAALFEEDFPDLHAKTAAPPPVEQFQRSAQWALGADGTKALDRLGGTMQRAIYSGDRETTVASAESNGMRWIRQARPGACAFCRMLATRTTLADDLYRSEDAAIGARRGSPRGRRTRGSRKLGDQYHDDCHCIARAIPAGADPMEILYQEEPEYATTVDMWATEYEKARSNAGSGDPKAILAEWRAFGPDIS